MRILQFVIALAVGCALCVQVAGAQENTPSVKEPVPDVRVIIDISGSMKQNDPQNLRRPALELLVRLFPDDSKAGVWTFGQWVNMLVPHKPVTDSWRKDALNKAQKINSVALHTNIPEVLVKATDDINRLDPKYKTSLILLTDGMVDVSKSPEDNNKARQRILDEIIPSLRNAGIVVHTIALSNNADQELMERLAADTNGLAAIAETAQDLTPIFLQAFDAAAPAEQLPLEGNTFLVDSSIEEFTLLVFRKEGSSDAILVAPDGKRYTQKTKDDDLSWFRQLGYDLITVKRPYEGQWSIIADLAPNSRVTIVSNLSLQVPSLDKGVFVGSDITISAALIEKEKIIVNPELLDLVDVSVDIKRRNDNRQWTVSLSHSNRAPEKGVFASALDMMQEAGVYDITVRANGKTFQRQYQQTVEVRDTFTISITTSNQNPPNHKVTLFAANPAVDAHSTKVTARIKLPDADNETLSLFSNTERTWVLPIQGIEQSGMYRITFEIAGKYDDGSSFNYSPNQDIEHYVSGSPFTVDTVEPEEPSPSANTEPKPSEESTADTQPVEPIAKDEGMDTETIALYSGIALGNLLVLILGFYAYKMITKKPSSETLEDDDIEDDDGEQDTIEPVVDTQTEPESEKVEEPETEVLDNEGDDIDEVDIDLEDNDLDDLDLDADDSDSEDELGDILDLPDDAIDIDPGADEEPDK